MRGTVISATLAGAVLAAGGAAAQSLDGTKPTLPAEPVIPTLHQHDKPSPFPIMPLYDLGKAPAEMPYRTDAMTPGAGVLSSVMGSAAPTKIGLGYSGAGDAREAFVQTAIRGAEATMVGSAIAETAGNYEDGSGREVRFGYDRHTEQVGLVLRPLPGTTLRAGVVNDVISDHRLPLVSPVVQDGVAVTEGFGADSVSTRRLIVNLGAEQTAPITGVDRLKLDLRYVGLDRVNRNFELRSTPATNPMEARPSRDTFTAALSGDMPLSDAVLARLTLSGEHVDHDAARHGGPNTSLATLSGLQYPGVEMTQAGVNLDIAWKPQPPTDVTFGVRYDYVSGSASKLDTLMQVGAGAARYTGTPRSLYRQYYGDVSDSREDHMLSAKVDAEHRLLDDRLSLTGSVGRIMRAADTQERYFAMPSMNNTTASGYAARQVGNPDLAPEQHYRAEAGIALKGDDWLDYGRKRPGGDDWLASQSWRLSLGGHVEHVVDFISRDRAHGQDGILRADNAFIWRNVDAQLAGIDLEAAVNLTRNWSTRVGLTWQWGENTDDGRALYGINPLEANWLVDYQDTLGSIGTWNAGAKLRMVAGQDRADLSPATGSGFDPGPVGGFTLLDLYAGVQLYDTVGLRLGVDNVFDRTYAEHNPYTSTDETNPSAVYGPGRTVYVRGVVTF